MSNSGADRVANLRICISQNGADQQDGAPASVCCSVPVYHALITPENCRSLAVFLTNEKLAAPPQIVIDPEEAASVPRMDTDASFLSLMKSRRDVPTDIEEKASDGGFEFSDEEEKDTDTPEPVAATGKRGRLEIASSASDLCLEPIPEDFENMEARLQREFQELRTIPVVAKSQEARISTIEDEKQAQRKKWGDLEPDAPKNARFTYDIEWDVFMPNLFILRQARMLMIGGVDFSNMFKPVLGLGKKSLSHTERVLSDISKNTHLPRDHIFLKIPFPGAKKKDGCRAIPFGFIPLVLHYLRPAALRERIILKKTRSLLLRCYRQVVLFFRGNMPAIVRRQLRQFSANMTASLLGPIGLPLALLDIRSGAVDTSVAGPDISIESVSESEAELDAVTMTQRDWPKKEKKRKKEKAVKIPEADHQEDTGVTADPGTWPSFDDYGFSEEDDDEVGDDVSMDAFDDEESMEITEAAHPKTEKPRRTGLLREQLLEMRYNHHTDDELDALISHHLDVIGELNEVRKLRRVASRPLRERFQRSTSIPSISLKRERPLPLKKKHEERELVASQPSAKRVAVPSNVQSEETPKNKLRVYRMQSNQLLSSLPEVIEWTTELLAHVTQFRTQFRQHAGDTSGVENGDSEIELSEDSRVEGHESESLGMMDSEDMFGGEMDEYDDEDSSTKLLGL